VVAKGPVLHTLGTTKTLQLSIYRAQAKQYGLCGARLFSLTSVCWTQSSDERSMTEVHPHYVLEVVE
jgi:hypothetical protein